jgi:hypothetical protein
VAVAVGGIVALVLLGLPQLAAAAIGGSIVGRFGVRAQQSAVEERRRISFWDRIREPSAD